jgi:hypothetical protein
MLITVVVGSGRAGNSDVRWVTDWMMATYKEIRFTYKLLGSPITSGFAFGSWDASADPLEPDEISGTFFQLRRGSAGEAFRGRFTLKRLDHYKQPKKVFG